MNATAPSGHAANNNWLNSMHMALMGLGEGITIPLAFASGLFLAGQSFEEIITLVCILGAFSALLLGIGTYFSDVAEQKTFLENNEEEAHHHVESEAFYENIGLPGTMRQEALQDAEEEQQEWEDFMHTYNLQQQKVNYTEAIISALAVFTAYLSGTLLVLFPYMFMEGNTAFWSSLAISMLALVISGALRAKHTGYPASVEAGSSLGMAVTAVLAAWLMTLIF